MFTNKEIGHETKHTPGGRMNAAQGSGYAARQHTKHSERQAAFEAEVAQRVVAWREANPRESAWLEARSGTVDFAASLTRYLLATGGLSDGQMASIQRSLASESRVNPVKIAGNQFAQILGAFQRATASGLRHPALTFDFLTFKPAGASSMNAGSIYVTRGREFGSPYVGRISGVGVFWPSQFCGASDREAIERIALDPMGAAVSHGKLTGRCACCGRPLTDDDSVERGIGPICAKRYFGSAAQ